ncbi:hypothetical protein CG747_24890 [Streptomyces sp. CB02959]|uniref:DUF6300 family protein n=1 Tax=Streptomyces sp. CB02959 TaxID=2020330 RepID=UPI000C280435|nr:DUF6300 family protein [Streptomyces sp. CB02959]PJN38123.1 hypothetical protein CG747_24890 [Streptomyces sp. CB02959]
MTPAPDLPHPIALRAADPAPPPCPRCRTAVLLVARYPHTWHNRSGEPVHGLRESVLCASCDPDDPAAAGLLALFADGGLPAPATPDALGPHLRTWLAAVRRRAPHRADLDAEEARWRAGEL